MVHPTNVNMVLNCVSYMCFFIVYSIPVLVQMIHNNNNNNILFKFHTLAKMSLTI